MRGYQLVIHGYFFSCMVFFFVQFKGKALTSQAIEKKKDQTKEGEESNLSIVALQAFVISLIGTALAEIASIPFYYPYDLINVRMQTMHDKYGYRNFLDGLIKIWNENKKSNSKTSKILKRKFYLMSGNTIQLNYKVLIILDKFARKLSNIRFYYCGAFYYGLAYTLFISLEFGIHDMLIEYISEFTESKDKSILEFLQIMEKTD